MVTKNCYSTLEFLGVATPMLRFPSLFLCGVQGSQNSVLLLVRNELKCTPLVDVVYAEEPNSPGNA